MKPMMIFVACSALLMSTSASAAPAGDFQSCSQEAYDIWQAAQQACEDAYENDPLGVPGTQWERDQCLVNASDQYGFALDQCRQMYPEGVSYTPQRDKAFDDKRLMPSKL